MTSKQAKVEFVMAHFSIYSTSRYRCHVRTGIPRLRGHTLQISQVVRTVRHWSFHCAPTIHCKCDARMWNWQIRSTPTLWKTLSSECFRFIVGLNDKSTSMLLELIKNINPCNSHIFVHQFNYSLFNGNQNKLLLNWRSEYVYHTSTWYAIESTNADFITNVYWISVRYLYFAIWNFIINFLVPSLSRFIVMISNNFVW